MAYFTANTKNEGLIQNTKPTESQEQFYFIQSTSTNHIFYMFCFDFSRNAHTNYGPLKD